MPGTRMKAGLPLMRCAALLDRVLERLEAGDGAGDGVLRATQVVVDDLDELARALARRSSTKAATSSSARPTCEGRIAARR